MDMVVEVIGTARAEQASAREIEALDEADAEFAEGKTHRLDDVLHGLGRKTR